jgi:hypothetical protein
VQEAYGIRINDPLASRGVVFQRPLSDNAIMTMQRTDQGVPRPYDNKECWIALSWAGLSLLFSAVLLVFGYFLFSPSMVAQRSGQAPGVTPQSMPGAALEIRLGGGYNTSEKALAVNELQHGVDERAIATVGTRFNAADFRMIEYRLAGRHPETHVYLIWRTAGDPETMFNMAVPLGEGSVGVLLPGGHAGWTGQITEIGFDIYGELREPLLIESISLSPWTWQGALISVWGEWGDWLDWSSSRGWTQRSINGLRAVHRPGDLSPVLTIAAWSGLACLLLALASPMARSPRPLGFLFAVAVPWLAIDLLWQSSLFRQLDETRHLFAGKTQQEKHLAGQNNDLYRYASYLKAEVLPAPGTRIFLLQDTAHRTYRRLRAQYYLLPHNIYNYDRFPRPEYSTPGDYILVLGKVPGLAYERGALRWAEQSLPAELVDLHSMGSVYRIGGGGQ